MALVDPYSPCPCGSGEKFKWCCQKVEAYAERAQRLAENGQYDQAIASLDEGLARARGNPLLLMRKAIILLGQERVEEARSTAEELVRKHPDHFPGALLLIRLIVDTEGPIAGAIELQSTLAKHGEKKHPMLARIAGMIAMGFLRDRHVPAAIKHLELASQLGPAEDDGIASTFEAILSNDSILPWLKNPYHLSAPPNGLDDAGRASFEQALGWADAGLFQSAAAAFDLLSGDPRAGMAADRNLGLCRLWLGDDAAAVEALRRWIGRTSDDIAAVDLEILCQIIDPHPGDESIEEVELSWPIRDRDGLLAKLRGLDTVIEGTPPESELEEDEPPPAPTFHLLDRPKIEPRSDLTFRDIPVILADVIVGDTHVVLQAPDDGRLNGVIDQFTALAGTTVPPAHPRTKVVGKTGRSQLAMSWNWYMDPSWDLSLRQRLSRDQLEHVLNETWPDTPQVYLGGKTPLQVAPDPRYQIPLRAALILIGDSGGELGELIDMTRLRARLKLEPEPPIDPKSVSIDRLNLGRLESVPVAELDDDRLLSIYARARGNGLTRVLGRAAQAIALRPGLATRAGLPGPTVYGDLIGEAIQKGDRERALEWLRRGREADDPANRAKNDPIWDMTGLHVRMVFDAVEEWVPDLAIILERYRGNDTASREITVRLMQTGLIRMVQSPERGGGAYLDTRPLQELLSRFGPKVTTAEGTLGVSASRGKIWTPGEETGGGAIWTPGSPQPGAPSGETRRLILPGQ